MTPQEQQMLMSLAQRVNQTQLQEKDPDAENLLGRELGANPDALYILAQTVLVQDIALQQAKAQVTQLQQQAQQAPQPAKATSFLGGLFGRHDSPQPVTQVPQPPQAQPAPAPPYQPVPSYQQPQYQQPVQPQYYPQPQSQFVSAAPAGQPSFLRGAVQTAAGVAAGALAFEGVESILHGFGHPGYGGGFGGFEGGMSGMGMGPGIGLGGFERPVDETTVVNNYYDAPGGGGEHRFDAGGEQHLRESGDQQGGYQLSDANYTTPGNDAGQGYQLSDASYTTQGNDDVGQGGYDQSMADDSAAYDNSADDIQLDDSGSGFDDGGGSDNNY